MAKPGGTAPFVQPSHGMTGNSTGKNKSEMGFQQNPFSKGAGSNSSKKNPSEASFAQTPPQGKAKAQTGGVAPFEQPNHGGSAPMPKVADKTAVVQKKMKKASPGQPQVAPPAKFTSIASVMSYRKKKFGV